MKEGKVPVTRRRARQCDANEADAHVEILKRADDWVRQKKMCHKRRDVRLWRCCGIERGR